MHIIWKILAKNKIQQVIAYLHTAIRALKNNKIQGIFSVALELINPSHIFFLIDSFCL